MCICSIVNANDWYDELFNIQYLVESHSDCISIIGGDFSVDWSRVSVHTQYLSDLVTTHNIRCIGLDTRFTINYNYQFSVERFSVIDHFLLLRHNFDVDSDILHNLFVEHNVDS